MVFWLSVVIIIIISIIVDFYEAIIILAIIAVICSVLVGCSPTPANTSQPHLWSQKECDSNGICCYSSAYKGDISCASTRIEIIPAKENNVKSLQRESQVEGEVSSRAIEARILREFETQNLR